MLTRVFVVFVVLISCSPKNQSIENPFSGPNPWPEIRKERVSTLLPEAMKRAKVDTWLVLCRENNNDPLAIHVDGENASSPAAFVFIWRKTGYQSWAFLPLGEAQALKDVGLDDTVVVVPRGESALKMAADFIKKENPKTIAVNTSDENELADGLSHTQYETLKMALGDFSKRLLSATELVYQWLSIKTDKEVEILAKAAELTAK